MDAELMTQIVALLTGVWTVYQEWRHRKAAKVAKVTDVLPVTPRRKK